MRSEHAHRVERAARPTNFAGLDVSLDVAVMLERALPVPVTKDERNCYKMK